MDTKLTLSFNSEVITKAKKYAAAHNLSLSRMIEIILQKITSANYSSMEEFPIAGWVQEISEGEAVYTKKFRKRKETKKTFYKSRK